MICNPNQKYRFRALFWIRSSKADPLCFQKNARESMESFELGENSMKTLDNWTNCAQCALSDIRWFLVFTSAGLDAIKINVTHRMNSKTFSEIVKLGSGLKKKAKKKKGKPGKVKSSPSYRVAVKMSEIQWAL